MNQRSRALTLICLIGLLANLLLAGAILVARQHTLFQTTATSHTPLSGEAEWEGEWEFSELGADPSEAGSQAGTDRVTISFAGTDFALRVRRANCRGYFFVSVDGEPANLLPQEERGAYLVLTSPDYAGQVVTIPVASGLDDGPHIAVVIAERGWDQWPLVGWRASHTPDTTAYRSSLAGLGALALACLAGVVWWGASGVPRKPWRQLSTQKHPRMLGIIPLSRLCATFAQVTKSVRLGDNLALVAALTAAALFYFSRWPLITLVSGLVLAVLVLFRPDAGLALVAVTAPFHMQPRPLFGKVFSMAEITTLLCLLSWCLRQLVARCSGRPGPQCPASGLDHAVLIFIVTAITSAFVARHSLVALRELRVLILEPSLFYLLLRASQLDDRAIWRIVDLFVLGGVIVALIGLVQYLLGVNVTTAEMGFHRLRSVYGSPNNVGLYLGRVLPVLMAIVLFGGSRVRQVAYGLAAVPVGLAVLLSFSRGALILGVPLSLLALGALARRRWSWASLGAVTVAAALAILLLHTPRFASLFDTRSGSTFFRLQLWRSSWMMFRDHLWLGVGPDNFLYFYRSRYILPTAWQEPDLSHAHNVLLDYGCRLGLCGLVVGLWLQIAFWRLALPLRHLPVDSSELPEASDHHALALGLMGSMVNFLTHGLVDASYFVIDLAFAFFLTLGVAQWLAKRRG